MTLQDTHEVLAWYQEQLQASREMEGKANRRADDSIQEAAWARTKLRIIAVLAFVMLVLNVLQAVLR